MRMRSPSIAIGIVDESLNLFAAIIQRIHQSLSSFGFSLGSAQTKASQAMFGSHCLGNIHSIKAGNLIQIILKLADILGKFSEQLFYMKITLRDIQNVQTISWPIFSLNTLA